MGPATVSWQYRNHKDSKVTNVAHALAISLAIYTITLEWQDTHTLRTDGDAVSPQFTVEVVAEIIFKRYFLIESLWWTIIWHWSHVLTEWPHYDQFRALGSLGMINTGTQMNFKTVQEQCLRVILITYDILTYGSCQSVMNYSVLQIRWAIAVSMLMLIWCSSSHQSFEGYIRKTYVLVVL